MTASNHVRFCCLNSTFKPIFLQTRRGAFTFLLFSVLLLWMPSFSLKDQTIYNSFYDFVVHYKRPYISNITEMHIRFEIFKDNLARAKHFNKVYNDSKLPVYGVNKFADLSPQEFRAQYLAGLVPSHGKDSKKSQYLLQKEYKDPKHLGLPKVVDWRKVLTSVNDQGSCGACWSFSVVETMESMYAIEYNISVSQLSVQQLIDCDTSNSGCEGGDICEASSWATKIGVVSASMYPLTDHTDKCKILPDRLPRVYVKDHYCGSYIGHEEEILRILAEHGPVAVAIDASTWHNYVGGIIQYHCSNNINHAVQIVGYDLTGDVPYYIVRNSWGKDFGDKGFLYIKYGNNLCGLSTEVVAFNVTK